MLRLKQSGDTIVEVMIVLAMLGLALSIAYATANRSLVNTRQAQENAEATEILRGQIEALRAVSCSDPTVTDCSAPAIVHTTQEFCMKPEEGENWYVAIPYTETDCQFQSIPYKVSIKNVNITQAQYQFIARWDSVQGGEDRVILTYRLPR